MKKAILVLWFVLVAVFCAENAHAAKAAEYSATTGWGDDTVNQILAEEFTKCSAFNGIAAECVKSGPQGQQEKATAGYKDVAKKFYRGSYMLAGQSFTQKRIQVHKTSMRRNAGKMCEGFSKLEQQHRKRCDDTFKRLPRSLQ